MKSPRPPTISTWSRCVHSPVTLGVLLLLTLYTGTIIYPQWKKERAWNTRVSEQEVEVRAARERHDALKARVAYAESDVGKEEYLRQSYSVAQYGESLIILSETKKEASAEIMPESAIPPGMSWWQQFMAKILNM